MAAPSSFSMTRRRIPTWLKAVAALLAAGVVVLVVWALLIVAAYLSTFWKLGPELRVPQATVTVGTQEPRAAADTHTVLIAAIDRDGTLDAPPAILQYGAGRAIPVVVVIPKELTVVSVNDDRQTFADVHAVGGIIGLRQAVVDFTEVMIDDVIVVSPRDVAGFIDLIDGLTWCDPACRELDGTTFMSTYTMHDDYDRLTYLAAVLSTAAELVDRSWVVRHPRRAWQAVSTVSATFDTTMSLRGGVVLRALDGLRVGVEPVWVTTPILRTREGVVLAAPEPSMLQFAALREGTPVAPSATVSVEELRQQVRDETRVAVANAAGVQGLAALVTEQLSGLGFNVVASGNASRFDQQQTEIVFDSGDARAEFVAEELAEALDAVLRPQTEPVLFEGARVDVLVLVGEKAAS